jgi:hypothetical protein
VGEGILRGWVGGFHFFERWILFTINVIGML